MAFCSPGLDTGIVTTSGLDWPLVSIAQAAEPLELAQERLDSERVEFALADGLHTLLMARAAGTAVFHGPLLAPDELVHPYLWPVASIFSRWHGREALHAGAVIIDGGAWALIGPKEAGKSTLVAAHAAAGGLVLSDDLVVVDGERAFAGPRCVDLRQPLPDVSAADLRPTRGGMRLRMTLNPVELAVPLRGWVFLRWGQATELERLSGSTCLMRLASWRAWGDYVSSEQLILALAGLPAYELTREREWGALATSLRLLNELGSA